MSSFVKSADQPIAAEGGLHTSHGLDELPYRALDELMVVIEVFCPNWPARPTFPEAATMLM